MSYYVSYYSNSGFGPTKNTGTFHTKAEATAKAKLIKSDSPQSKPIVIKSGKIAKRNPQHGSLPIGKFVKAQAVRQNANGTVTVKIARGAVRRPATKRRRK